MQEISSSNFGLLIAYVLPGFVLLAFFGRRSSEVGSWIEQGSELTVAGFLYTTLASVAVGMILSAIRWLVVDTMHHWTGLKKRSWDFRKLQHNIAAHKSLVENQYRYYQAYANSLVAIAFVLIFRAIDAGTHLSRLDLGLAATMLILIAASRDTLKKYYERLDDIFDPEGSPAGSG